MQNDTANKIHELYLQCRDTFNPSNTIENNSIKIKNREEKLFYCAVSDFFIQQKQKEIIEDQ